MFLSSTLWFSVLRGPLRGGIAAWAGRYARRGRNGPGGVVQPWI